MSEPRPIYPKHFLRDPVPRANTGFILMPFADEFEPVHEAIRAAIESAGLEPLRADDIFSTRAGMEKILRGIAEAEVVVADMSGQNANVFYEAGIAHMAKENVVLLTQDRDDFPFDLQHIDHVVYEPTVDGLIELTTKLAEVIRGLPPERPSEAPQVQPVATHPTTPAELRRAVRRKLQDCERQWVEEVVPAQSEVFNNSFRERIRSSRTGSEQREAIAQSAKSLHEAFLAPWLDVEAVGFPAIGQADNATLTDLIQALEQAYTLSDRTRGDRYVVGHGRLLAFRTWTLWGACALECQNWSAVTTLLHGTINVGGTIRESLSQTKNIHHLDVVGQSAITAAELVYTERFGVGQQNFGSVEAMQSFSGLWLFAADIAYATSAERKFDNVLFPTWALAPRRPFEALTYRLATDPEYAKDFLGAVGRTDTASMNEKWAGGLREEFQTRGRPELNGPLPGIPIRFAE